jgi:hypothetical protein
LSKLAVSSRARAVIIDSAEVRRPGAKNRIERRVVGRSIPRTREEHMALQVHGSSGDVGKTILWIVGIVAFVVIALTKVPELISPNKANITGETGATTRMIN